MENNLIGVCDFEGCNLYLEKPITLTCGHTVCHEHVNQYKSFYKCSICNIEHQVPENGFKINTAFEKLIILNQNLNGLYKETKFKFDKFTSFVDFLNKLDPESFVTSHFTHLRNKVETHREEMIAKLRDESTEIIHQLDKIENECKTNLEKNNSSDCPNKQNQDAQTSELKMKLRNPKIIDDLEEMKKLSQKLDEEINYIQNYIQKYENEHLLMNMKIKFEPNNNFKFCNMSVTIEHKNKLDNKDIIKRKALNTIEDIRNNNSFKVFNDFDEFKLVYPTNYTELIQQLIIEVLNRDDSTRQLLGELLLYANKKEKISLEDVIISFRNVLEIAEDMVINVPKITTYLSQIINPFFQIDIFVDLLLVAFEQIKYKRIYAEFKNDLLRCATKRSCRKESTDKATQSNSTEYFETKLHNLLKNPQEENEIILQNIKNEFDESDLACKPFIRSLVVSVCRSCYMYDSKLDTGLFKKRSSILKFYLAESTYNELEALFAVQSLDYRMKHKPGFIRILFHLLYDEGIVREDVFWRWKKEDNEEGHAGCVFSLGGFFQWLEETDDY